MKITSLDQIPSEPMQMEGVVDVLKQTPLGNADGVPNFSFRVFTIKPGGHTPYHSHDWEHLNYIIEGEGVLVDADGNHNSVKAGDFGFVEPNMKHQYRNVSETDDLIFICAVTKQYE